VGSLAGIDVAGSSVGFCVTTSVGGEVWAGAVVHPARITITNKVSLTSDIFSPVAKTFFL
jgi:hypothetical protein